MGELLRDVLQEIGADPTRFLAETAQSLLLLGILYWFGRKPLRRRLDAHLAAVVAELAEAAAAEQDAARLAEEARSHVARAKDEAPAAVHEVEEGLARDRQAGLDRIEAEAREMVEQARQAVERDKVRVAGEAAGRLVALTTEATRRYLDEMLSESERRALTQRAIHASLEAMTGAGAPGAGPP